jgi:hypothetical protein
MIYFGVPKVVIMGEVLDIQMVYDAIQSGLNSVLWAPNFVLANMASHMQSSPMRPRWETEMFLNFQLDERIQPYVGVDLMPLVEGMNMGDKSSAQVWEW